MKHIKIPSERTVWLISDTHFFHSNIIKYCDRPFEDADVMNETMFNNWNDTVSNDDVVFFLGDFVVGSKDKNGVSKILYDQLKGEKYFIRGNHDLKVDSIPYIDETIKLTYDDKTFTLGHYPKDTWKTDYSLHGHVHNNGHVKYKNSFNVSIENIDYKPINIRDIINICNERD